MRSISMRSSSMVGVRWVEAAHVPSFRWRRTHLAFLRARCHTRPAQRAR